mmetsp:Transcript_21484/g.50981  ORF Transcript_21484/g.50981 Transcript_21484/m.50981 type:complete len:86 (+) Transcript_21484:1144-1401(+)
MGAGAGCVASMCGGLKGLKSTCSSCNVKSGVACVPPLYLSYITTFLKPYYVFAPCGFGGMCCLPQELYSLKLPSKKHSTQVLNNA